GCSTSSPQTMVIARTCSARPSIRSVLVSISTPGAQSGLQRISQTEAGQSPQKRLTLSAGRRRLGSTPPCSEHHGCADGKLGVIKQREDLRDLLIRDESGVDGLLSNLLEVGTHQVCAGRPSLPQGQLALHAYIDKTMRPQATVQAPAPCQCQLATSCCHEPTLDCYHLTMILSLYYLGKRGRI